MTALEARLAQTSEEAAFLREKARDLLIDVVADAHQLGMTQREIARGLHRSQPEISRLLGLSSPRFMPKSPLGRRLVENRHEVIAAVEGAGASNVRVFGSLARGEDGPESDVDLLIEIPRGFGLFALSGLKLEIEELLDHSTDVVPDRGLRGKVRAQALLEAVPL